MKHRDDITEAKRRLKKEYISAKEKRYILLILILSLVLSIIVFFSELYVFKSKGESQDYLTTMILNWKDYLDIICIVALAGVMVIAIIARTVQKKENNRLLKELDDIYEMEECSLLRTRIMFAKINEPMLEKDINPMIKKVYTFNSKEPYSLSDKLAVLKADLKNRNTYANLLLKDNLIVICITGLYTVCISSTDLEQFFKIIGYIIALCVLVILIVNAKEEAKKNSFLMDIVEYMESRERASSQNNKKE